jgi:penicillin-binding protein 1A
VALGAYEVNLLEMTSGYQVFQQGGRRTAPYLIEQIATTRGDSVYVHDASPGVSVYDTAKAGEMVRMMEGVITKGTAQRAAFGRPAAGKTGTTQNWRDAWFIGFTPDWVCGVWIGNDDGAAMNKVTGGQLPAAIWRRMMIAAHLGLPVRDFDWMPPPDPLETPPPAEAPTNDTVAIATPAATGPDQKTGFYQDLSADFGHAVEGKAPPAAASTPPPSPAPETSPAPVVTPTVSAPPVEPVH